jgi:hypothetical protein
VAAPSGWAWLDEALGLLALTGLGVPLGKKHWSAISEGFDPLEACVFLRNEEWGLDEPLAVIPSEETAPLIVSLVCGLFNDAAMTGEIATAYTAKGAGELLPMPLGAWRTDQVWTRFRGGHFNPDHLTASDAGQPFRVVAKVDNVIRLGVAVADWVKSLPRYSPERESENGPCRVGRIFGLPLPPLGELGPCLAPTVEFFWQRKSGNLPVAANDKERMIAVQSEPLPVATEAELTAWLEKCVTAKMTQSQVDKGFRNAVPGKAVRRDRDWVRETYGRIYAARTGDCLRPGPRPK